MWCSKSWLRGKIRFGIINFQKDPVRAQVTCFVHMMPIPDANECWVQVRKSKFFKDGKTRLIKTLLRFEKHLEPRSTHVM
jgi:hypothetical protein